jgi:8-oxo-dGTP pyrophosphatase MutT (NUDIX family)
MKPLENFSDFSAFIFERLRKPLPGKMAQLKLAPPHRAHAEPETGYRLGCVCLPIKDVDGIPHLVMIKRAHDGKVHSGQMAFPGGKAEEGETPEAAALRELNEEIGIPTDYIRMAGPLTSLYIPPSNFKVIPFVVVQHLNFSYILNYDEVSSIVELPLNQLSQQQILQSNTRQVTLRGTVNVPAYVINDTVIWGASAMILAEFLALFE